MSRAIAALLLVAAPLAAQNYVETFTGGVNLGGWTYGANSAVQAAGGNPGSWLHTTNLDTFAPQLRTTGSGGPFAGNWRSQDIDSVGVDLITVSTQFPADRECTLMLTDGTWTVYYVDDEHHVPQPGTGWRSFEFVFDSDSPTLPPGWALLQGAGAEDFAWNQVITNVKTVTFFYGDPTFFFIFDIWNVGADNIRIGQQAVWTDLGQALAGAGGVPELTGNGQLLSGSQMVLSVTGAAASAPATLVAGVSRIDAPFKGGVLVPQPDVLVALVSSPAGAINLVSTWPAGIPSGTSLYLQTWIADAGGPKGFAATNGLRGTAP